MMLQFLRSMIYSKRVRNLLVICIIYEGAFRFILAREGDVDVRKPYPGVSEDAVGLESLFYLVYFPRLQVPWDKVKIGASYQATWEPHFSGGSHHWYWLGEGKWMLEELYANGQRYYQQITQVKEDDFTTLYLRSWDEEGIPMANHNFKTRTFGWFVEGEWSYQSMPKISQGDLP